MFVRNYLIFLIIFLFFFPSIGISYDIDQLMENPKELRKLSLESLMDIPIFSVSKREESSFEAAAAVYVISREDIRRSGAQNIPEALRMVPGLEVASIDANKWAITSRGFQERFSNKLLVLIDGRSVYTPLFSGAYWDVQDTLLEDINRIEVIRGPGGTLWGANAANGVINIITKKASKTQGAYVEGGVGSVEKGFGSLRYGGELESGGNYRGYLKYFNRDNFDDLDGNEGSDSWDSARGGFRMDSDISEKNSVTFQGDYYQGDSGTRSTLVESFTAPFSQTADEDVQVSGGNLLARLERNSSPDSNIRFQFYYDLAKRKERVLHQTIQTTDLDFQQSTKLFQNQRIVWGLGQRFIIDKLNGGVSTSFPNEERLSLISSSFIQDEISFMEDKLRLILGTKLSWNNYSGVEIQPNFRLLLKPSADHTFWGSISRAVRTPSRSEDGIKITGTAIPSESGTTFLTNLGSHNFDSEDLIAYELGYRFRMKSNFLIDLTGFYNDYDNLITAEPGSIFFETAPSPSKLIFPINFDNKGFGETFGVELNGKLDVTDWWRLNASFTWLEVQLHVDDSSSDTFLQPLEDTSPEFQFHIRSYLDLPKNFELDSALYFVNKLDGSDIPSYTRLDIRLGWNPVNNIEISLGVFNILDPDHPEFGPDRGSFSTQVPRSALGKLSYKF
jgi:iron complex outermembrane recepter protein